MAIKLPQLGPTGKKVAIGAAAAGALTLAGLTISKKAEDKRVAQANAEYDKKYPLSNNCTELKIFLDKAKLELAQLESASGGDAGAKRIRARNANSLKNRIVALEQYFATLDCANKLAADLSLPQAQETDSTTRGVSQYIWYGVAALAAILLFTNLSKKD